MRQADSARAGETGGPLGQSRVTGRAASAGPALWVLGHGGPPPVLGRRHRAAPRRRRTSSTDPRLTGWGECDGGARKGNGGAGFLNPTPILETFARKLFVLAAVAALDRPMDNTNECAPNPTGPSDCVA